MLKLPENCRILVIKPSALGDIVHSMPFLHAVKKRYPKGQVHWVVADGLSPFLENHPLIDRLWIFRKERWKKPGRWAKTIVEVWEFVSGLRRQRFDVSVDLSGLLRSGLITWAGGARHRLGFDTGSEGSPFFYTTKLPGDMTIHAIDRYLSIAAYLDCDISEIRYPMAPHDPEPPILKELPEKYCIMVPAAGKEANRWPAERFAELAARLPLPSVLLGSPGDAGVADRVVAGSHGKAISLAGRTGLKDLMPVIAKAKFAVTNDTGPMHMAAACNVPVFAIFGPANPVRTGPYGDIHTVIRQELDCSPCYAWKPCGNWRCMEEITVDRVYDEIMKKQFGD